MALGCFSCQQEEESDRPNVILIMADDMGYECLGVYGSTSYSTPRLDQLAQDGVLFDQCISQPLCTPSRVKIMTGQFNYRNYEYFGYLDTAYQTFGNVMKEGGYATCIVGKWQLNGLAYKDELGDWQDASRPQRMGFDEHCLWQLTRARREGERFANALIEVNGEALPRDSSMYGPDVFTDYLIDFVGRNKQQPFFVYYPMVLVHEPFVPTPDVEAWEDPNRRYEKDTAYFKDMVAYTDKLVGRIADSLASWGLLDNTLLIFTGDNGTHFTIHSATVDGWVQGGKGNTTDAGTRVPLIAHWPAGGQSGVVHPSLIEFSDFFPTLADIAGRATPSDGLSFLPILTGGDYEARQTAFVHYDPKWGTRVNQYRNQFARTVRHKLYDNGLLYDLESDPQEQSPLDTTKLGEEAVREYRLLKGELARHPDFEY